MSENNHPQHGLMSADVDLWAQAPQHGFWKKTWFWLKFWIWVKTARLRFIAILALIGGVIASWDTLRAHYDKWTRPATVEHAASSDSEFFCPMHPQIVRDNPKDKCPICFMPLSKRKKGEDTQEALPPGVVNRVQLSPYRVVLAGVQTWEVGYQPLHKEITTVGFVEFDERRLARISVRVSGRSRIDKLHVNVTGQMVRKGDPLAELYSPDLVTTVQNLLDAQKAGNKDLTRIARERLQLWGIDNDQVEEILKTGKPITHVTIRSPISGHVLRKFQVEGEYVDEGMRLYDLADLSTVWVQAQVYEDEVALLETGMAASARTLAFPERTFTGKLSFVHPHMDQSTRTLTVRFDMSNTDHELRPGMYATVQLHVPAAKLTAVANSLAEEWREGTTADLTAHALFAPGGDSLGGLEPLLRLAGRYALLQQGLVLAVPESAIIDTGTRKIVYRQETPGTYEGVELRLGPRMKGPNDILFYPVLRGLEAGDRIVTNGSFLIDAETRLNPAAGSIYYGGSSGAKGGTSVATARSTTPADEDAEVKAARAKLPAADRRLVEAQEYCPILKTNRLGSMGPPVKIILNGQPVFLCCKGCVDKARANPEKTLADVEKLKALPKGSYPRTDTPGAGQGQPTTALSPGPGEEGKIQTAFAKLSPEDRRLAEAQRFCAVDEENRLGSMGVPVKVMVQGQPVFLCCKGCKDPVLAEPDKFLGKVKELKAKSAPPDVPKKP